VGVQVFVGAGLGV